MEKIKNCPFCGSQPQLIEASSELLDTLSEYGISELCCTGITCPTCGAKMVRRSKENVISAWNSRVSNEDMIECIIQTASGPVRLRLPQNDIVGLISTLNEVKFS